jgi:hypothetical protein
MAVRPRPTTWYCTGCGWSKTVHPRSDALGPGDHFRNCPRCNRNGLEHRPATLAEHAIYTLKDVLGGRGRK